MKTGPHLLNNTSYSIQLSNEIKEFKAAYLITK